MKQLWRFTAFLYWNGKRSERTLTSCASADNLRTESCTSVGSVNHDHGHTTSREKAYHTYNTHPQPRRGLVVALMAPLPLNGPFDGVAAPLTGASARVR